MALANGDWMRSLVGALLRAARDLTELSEVLAVLDGVDGRALSPSDHALVVDALLYVRTRAVLTPALQEHASALELRLGRPAEAESDGTTTDIPRPDHALGDARACAWIERPDHALGDARACAWIDRPDHALGDARACAWIDRPDHARGLARACAWIDRHVERFRVATGSEQLPSIKAIGELAHAGEILARGVDPARGRAWIARGWDALGEGAVIARRVEATAHEALLATVLPPFVRAGYRDDALLATIHAQISRSLFTPIEWALLAPVLRSLDLPVPPAGQAAATKASVLEARRAPWTLDLAAIYQLTHEVFYATAWGRDVARVAPESLAYVRRWLPCWLDLHVADEDVDVVAELLATGACTRTRASSVAWALLARAQADDGSIEPLRRADGRPGTLDDLDAFTRRSHPTLVAVMAWAM